MDIGSEFSNGICVTADAVGVLSEREWMDHPKFDGVRIKTLVAGEDCNNVLTSLLVSVDKGCALKTHIHDEQWEMHEVISGSGNAALGSDKSVYKPGVISVIPKGVEHSVEAGEEGLVLLAKFF